MNNKDTDIIEFERIKNLYQIGSYGLLGNIFLSSICLILLWPVSNHTLLLSWWSFAFIFNIARGSMVKKTLSRLTNNDDKTINIKFLENYYFTGVIISAVIWISLIVLPVREHHDLYFFSMMFIIGTAVVAATGTLSLSQKSSITFIFLVMTSFIFRILFYKHVMWPVMGITTLLLMITIIIMSKYLYKLQMDSLTFKLINTSYIDKLFKTNFSYAELNDHLEKKLKTERLIRDGLLEALEFQSSILENSISGTYVLDLDANIIQANQVGADILGYSKDELFGMSAKQVLDKEDFRIIMEKFKNLLANGEAIAGLETSIIKKNGTKAEIIFNASPIFKEGNIIGSVCSAEDITEKKRTEIIRRVRIEILEMLAAGKPLTKILHFLLCSFRKSNSGTGCAILVPNQHYNRLRFVVSLGLARSYRKWIEELINNGILIPSMQAMQRSTTIITDDVQNEKSWLPFFKNSRSLAIESCISHAIAGESGKPIAIFEIYSGQPLISVQVNMQLINEFGDLAKLVIERKTIENEVISRNKILSVLYKTSSVVLEEIQLDNLFKKILGLISGLQEYHVMPRIKIFINDNEHLTLYYDSHFAPDDTNNPCYSVNRGECLCGLCFENGEVIICENSRLDMLHEKKEAEMEDHGHIIIPLIGREKINGVLCLYTDPVKQNIEDNDKYFFLSIGRQIGLALENASLYKELEKHSLKDPLTGLANRYRMSLMISKLLPLAKRTLEPLSVALIDIDHFKNYNDTYGHQAGDSLLVILANILAQSVREEDLAVRYGGEEFLMIFANTNITDAQIILERIRDEIINTATVSISAGLASYNHTGSFDELISHADAALYQAKNSGRNRIIIAS